MRLGRPNTVFAQVFALVLTCVVATLALGLGVLAFSPPPPPSTVSISWFVEAYGTGSSEHISVVGPTSSPETWRAAEGQAEKLIGASLASGIGVKPSSVKIAVTTPSLFGLLPRSGTLERGQMTIIDVPASLSFAHSGSAFDMPRYLRNEAVRVPPFVATIRKPDGRFVVLRPREHFPTPWQLRLLTIFMLALLVVAPLAWLGARRWTDAIRRLASRVNRFDAQAPEGPLARSGEADEIRALEQAFDSLHARIRVHIDERTQMLMAVAHDLRTPLTSIRIRIEDVDECLRAGFLRDIARLDHMISGVLAFARAQRLADADETVDLKRLAEDLLTDTSMQGVEIGFRAETALVKGSAVDLSRAIENLLMNARRYADAATILIETTGETVSLSVIDDGPGVPEDAISRLTEPFFRVERSRNVNTGGVGLGLATVKAIVEAHGGSLDFESRTDGFVARLTLPAFRGE